MPGRHHTLEIPWHETRILNCSFCGRMIARVYWQDDDYPDEKFCEAPCADVKRSLAPARAGAIADGGQAR